MVGGCCVCSDERGWAENPLVYCDGHACSVAVHQGTRMAHGGRRDPGGDARRAPPAAPSGDLPALERPSPTPPEGKGGVGGLPSARSWRTGSGIVFLPIVPVPRPPPQVEGVWGQTRGQ